MLSHEQAEKRLKAFKVKDWERSRVAALGKLPAALKEAGLALLGRDAGGKSFRDWEKKHKAEERAAEALAKASAKERERLFAAFFPKLARHIEAGWQLWRRLPYEVDYDRKGFRAPDEPAVHNQARWNWLESLVENLKGYDPDVAWCAAWAPHLISGWHEDRLGQLFAAAIDAGGKEGAEVFEILKDSASNQHETGGMGRHVTRALLVASRAEGWEFVEKLLLAAQRQEGLRQVILESIDEAHPEAFRRMLRLILEHNLLRFSATVRAIDTWFGLQWLALTPAVLKKTVERVLLYLEDPAARVEALKTEKGEPLYLALWAVGFEDARKAVDEAAKLLTDPDVERRFVGVHTLEQLGLPAARPHLARALADPDLRVAVRALEALTRDEEGAKDLDLWDAVVALLARMPAKRQQGEALVWPWATTTLDRKSVAGALSEYRGKRPATALLPYIKDLDSFDRGQLVEQFAKLKQWDAATRDTLFDLVGDRDSWVRDKALAALKKCSVTDADAMRVEALLARKGSEMRQGVLSLLAKRKPAEALASADRLLGSKKATQRLGGLELLRLLVEKKKAVSESRQRAEAFRAKYPEPGEEEELHLEAILDVHRVRPTLDDALGLMDPALRTRPAEPKARKVKLCSAAAMACLQSLDKLIHEHRQTPITIKSYEGEEEQLLGDVGWGFPSPSHDVPPLEDARKNLPLFDLWNKWFESRPQSQEDSDGLELLRAAIWWNVEPGVRRQEEKRWRKGWGAFLDLEMHGQKPIKLRHGAIVSEVIDWLLRLHPPAGAADFLLHALETAFAHVPAEERARVVDQKDWSKRQRDWRNNSPADCWWMALGKYRRLVPKAFTEDHEVRLWRLLHWRDEPVPGVARMRPHLDYLIAGFKAGEANETDVLDHLIGPGHEGFGDLRSLTSFESKELKACPALGPIVGRVKERILEIELKRGEMPTAATEPAKALGSLPGIATLLRLLAALGSKRLARSTWGNGRSETFTHLIAVTHPGPQDSKEEFAAAMRQARVSRERPLELAFLAPAWLDHVEHALGWPGLKEGVWWYLAHMPGGRDGIGVGDGEADFDFDDEDFDPDVDDDTEEQKRPVSPWEKVLGERTPLTTEQRDAGAVDAAWFHRVYEPLGRKRWEALAQAAKFGTTGGAGHKKAIRLSEVLLGQAKKSDLVADIRDRKLKESVRLLGLLPLPEGERREPELLSRYKVLVEYRRYTRTLSPMSREDAERTATVGLENLARTAGYPDPLRLEWAMEAKQIADLAAGPVSVTQDGVTVTLAITPEAQPELSVRRGERPLKAVPGDVRKHPKVAAMLERRADLKRQASRVRYSLEAMMVRGDTFTGAELRQLFSHPLLRSSLERLVILGEGIRGYPVAEGQALEDYKGKREPVKPGERLRLAHPHDLFAAGDWDKWQHHCFAAEKVQPFKQLFRELYVVTAQEKADGAASHRYSGQQVQPRQAMALWGTRGWRSQDEVAKTFHDEGIVAEVTFKHHGWTPAQVEGLTLDAVRFHKIGEPKPMPLAEVPPRLFSEVMRDCDLVVSVAHAGGVDPEASASTTQMREALVRETCALLGIGNYKVVKTHVVIDGKLGTYTVHLGSGVVHRQPGGHVCIVPVHAQQRGRLFLPFADDDPRTAEVLSKVLLLARDHEIQDPTILEQLR